MNPQLIMTVIPTGDDIHAEVTFTAHVIDTSGIYRSAVIYRQMRLAQGLGEEMQLLPWALAALADHAEGIQGVLGSMINQGQEMFLLPDQTQQILS